jgi:hypothetical protein
MNSINFSRSTDFQTTIIRITCGFGSIQIRIDGYKLRARQRRTIGKAIFVQLKPFIGYLKNVYVHHCDGNPFDFNRAEERGLKTFDQPDFRMNRAQFGFDLRMLRQKRGLTLNEMSKKIGIITSHLSELERGLHNPRKCTLEKIKEFLKSEK